MKQIIYLFLIIGMLSSCITNPDKRSVYKVTNVEFIGDRAENLYGKYEYTVVITSSWGDMILYSDSIYNLGDTLKIIKQ